MSGIDASGKGFLASKVATSLTQQGVNVALLGADHWLNLPETRFSRENPAEHFYTHALRLEKMFQRLVLPLRDNRSVSLEFDRVLECATEYRPTRCEFRDVDIVLLEGIFIFKKPFRGLFDLACWVDCSFETALERAIARRQEGLPPAETARAFEMIYFPAQRIHFERDNPRGAADFIFVND